MANDGWSDYFDDWFEPEEQDLRDILFGGPGEVDETAQALFFDAFFEKDQGAYQELVDYVYDKYGIEFEEAFEWADFREWYDSQ